MLFDIVTSNLQNVSVVNCLDLDYVKVFESANKKDIKSKISEDLNIKKKDIKASYINVKYIKL